MNRWVKFMYMAALFLLIFGGRLWLIDRCGSDAPSWDQWDGIGGSLFLPYAGHSLTIVDFFKPHNEHRIVFTRLLSLGLMCANHQWDNRLETVVNAGIYALTAVLIFSMILKWGPWQIAIPLGFPALALAFTLPFSWENTLFGFQSQFYFLILFSVASMTLLTMNSPGSRRWLLGWVLGLLCIFTMASGFLAAAVVLMLAIGEGIRTPQRWKAAGLTVVAAALIILVGWVLNVSLERHQGLRAHSILQWVIAFGQNLSWPNLIWPSLTYPWLAFFNWLPFLLLAGVYYGRSEGPCVKLERWVLMLGLWVILQAAAMAYARSGPSWRYMDVLSLGMVVNVISMGLLMRRQPWPRMTGALAAVCAVWLMLCGVGLLTLTWRAVREEIPRKMELAMVQRDNIRTFMATGNGRCLSEKSSEEISFPGPLVLICLLRDPFIRDILPAGIRTPLKVEQKSSYRHAFVTNGVDASIPLTAFERAWGSYSDPGLAAEGVWISQPLSSRFPFLYFEVAGHLGEKYLIMNLVGVDDRHTTVIRPRRVTGRVWQPWVVRTPPGEFCIEAVDDHARRWFAFKEPTEVGWLSFGAIELTRKGHIMMMAGILLFGIVSVSRYFSGLRHIEGEHIAGGAKGVTCTLSVKGRDIRDQRGAGPLDLS